jgi:pantoate--beta-alanine ligase
MTTSPDIHRMRRVTWLNWRTGAATPCGCRMSPRVSAWGIDHCRHGRAGGKLGGSARPGYFRGVATVCAKLFGQVRPDTVYFGQKNWQQLQVVQRMVADPLLPLKVVGMPTVREPDGFALSSRNRFLEPDRRASAPRLFAILQSVALVLAGGCSVADLLAVAMPDLTADGFAVDYLALVEGASLGQLQTVQPGARLIAAARLGSVLLLDNVAVTPC